MKKLVILDTSAIMYRSYYAMQNLMNSKGFPTGAIFGFVKQLETCLDTKPEYIVAAYDVKKSDLNRKNMYEEYKANRVAMPDDLLKQVDIIKEIIKDYGINSFFKEGYEADDVIATLTTFGLKNGLEVHIYTGDKDIQQLVTDNNNVFIHLLGKGEVISTYEGVKKKLGVYPNQIPDFFGLKGDKSDGIPGVTGIGDVTGSKLIEKYDTLENIYENIEEIKGKIKEKLIMDKEKAFLSRELAKVKRDIDFDIDIEDLGIKEKNIEKLKEIFSNLELNTFLKSLNKEKKEVKIQVSNCDFQKIRSILKNATKASIYYTDNFFSCCVENIVYICENIEENTLFSEKINLEEINTKAEMILYDAKQYFHKGLKSSNFFDILIAAYVINTADNFEIENILLKYADISIIKLDKKILKNITLEELKDRQIKICYYLFQIEKLMKKKLKEVDEKDTYNKIEKPLIFTLFQMEENGIKIDKNQFKKLFETFDDIVNKEKKEIIRLAGCDFNIESPSQLADVLFNKMKIEGIKKTKRGFSTDAEVLEILANRGIEIAKHLLNFRYYKKLISTYVEPLPLYADKNDRIHSSFNGTGTVTGRLSSQNPNLQNIPTRTKEGNMIRNCFIAEKGMKLVSFDYSQIELRVLAELSGDSHLLQAYEKDIDLHEHTARKLFPFAEKIDKVQRNIGKTINFSVLYGKTSYGLSKELKISVKDAKKYIDTYFETYLGVTRFLEEIVSDCSQKLYVETLFGTRRYIPEINSKNSLLHEQAKRMAINTVIQGTAANIIKLVMLELQKKNYKMLVQVHDELIFELKEDEAAEKAKEIKNIMENTIKFKKVKLKVNYNIADKWGDLK